VGRKEKEEQESILILNWEHNEQVRHDTFGSNIDTSGAVRNVVNDDNSNILIIN